MLLLLTNDYLILGGCHVYADAEWIINRRPLWDDNDTLFGWLTPGRPVGYLGVGHSQGVLGDCSYYQSVMLFLNMVCLTVAFALTIFIIF
jgi:hypothetical protein